MAAYYEDFEIDQGSDPVLTVTLKEEDGLPKDLTGYSVSAKMKINYAADTGVSLSPIVADPATDGIVTMSLTNAQTTALNTRWRYVYDLKTSFYDSDLNLIVDTVLRGTIKVAPGVS